MKLLLDTHVLVWAVAEPERLSANARAALLDPENELQASHVSIWELALKTQANRPALPDLAQVEGDVEQVGVTVWVPIKPAHMLGTIQLPAIHRDPFDRLLIAQARHEGLTLVTRDPAIHKYPIATLW